MKSTCSDCGFPDDHAGNHWYCGLCGDRYPQNIPHDYGRDVDASGNAYNWYVCDVCKKAEVAMWLNSDRSWGWAAYGKEGTVGHMNDVPEQVALLRR